MFNRPAQLGSVVTLEGSLLQPVKNFVNNNKLDMRRFTNRSDGTVRTDKTAIPMIFSVRPREEGSPSGYAINIYTKNGFIHLPAGGQIFVAHQAGRITSISSVMPLRTLSFDEVMALARQIDDNITALGFEVEFANRNMTEEEALEDTRNLSRIIYAAWGKRTEAGITMTLKPFSKYSRVAFTTPIGSPPNKQEPETYLLDFDMSVGWAERDELRELKYARRRDITGDEDGDFPVKLWFDDPDWRPADWQGKWLK